MIENKRMLELQQGVNMRELGGYSTTDGRTVKWHKILRSGNMGDLTPTDIEFLKHYGLKYDIDFRSPSEVEYYPDRYPAGVKYVNVPVYPFEKGLLNNVGVNAYSAIHALENDNFVDESYIQMLVDKHARQAYRQMFDFLLANDKESQSLVFHCSAGKDRTGVGAFLILSALGVKLKIIKNDYLLTNLFFEGESAANINDLVTHDKRNDLADRLNSFLAVSVHDVEILPEACKILSGSVEGYLKQYLYVDEKQLEQLKSIYLE